MLGLSALAVAAQLACGPAPAQRKESPRPVVAVSRFDQMRWRVHRADPEPEYGRF